MKFIKEKPVKSDSISMWMMWSICSVPVGIVSGGCCYISKMGCTWNALKSKGLLMKLGHLIMTLFDPWERDRITLPEHCETLPPVHGVVLYSKLSCKSWSHFLNNNGLGPIVKGKPSGYLWSRYSVLPIFSAGLSGVQKRRSRKS